MLPCDTLQKHGQLGECQIHIPFAGHRPHEAALFEASGEQAHPVTIGPQYFHHFATATPEDGDIPGERVIFQRVLHPRGQTIEATTHICDASDDPDPGIRDTARALHISINAVVRTLKNSHYDV